MDGDRPRGSALADRVAEYTLDRGEPSPDGRRSPVLVVRDVGAVCPILIHRQSGLSTASD